MTRQQQLDLIRGLPPAARAELCRQLLARGAPLWAPLDGPQRLAYESQADVLGYGGAAGGGKTDLLFGLSITRHQRSIIFRREASQGRAVIDRAREVLGDLGRLNETTGVWRDLPGGRQIEFAGVKDPGDEQKFRGRPHDNIGFDEADHFLEFQARFLQGWLRTTIPGQRCRVVMCFNPPASAEGRWLLQYFGPWVDKKHPHPARPGELRWYATLPNGHEMACPGPAPLVEGAETITPRSRTFIPARVQDNPFLMSTGYIGQLQALPEPLRSQVLHGDFSAGIEDDPWQVIPTAWVEVAQRRWQPVPPRLSQLDALGVDVARGGRDKTTIAPRWGAWFGPLEKYPGTFTPDGPAVIALVERAVAPNVNAIVCLDVIGVGASPYDWGKATGRLPGLAPVDFRQGTERRDRSGRMGFLNLRAYAYWSLREALDPASGMELALPPDPEALADLTAPRWELGLRGVKIESKQELSKRLARSPDVGDAIVLAHLSLVYGAPWDATPPEEARSEIDRAPPGVFNS